MISIKTEKAQVKKKKSFIWLNLKENYLMQIIYKYKRFIQQIFCDIEKVKIKKNKFPVIWSNFQIK